MSGIVTGSPAVSRRSRNAGRERNQEDALAGRRVQDPLGALLPPAGEPHMRHRAFDAKSFISAPGSTRPAASRRSATVTSCLISTCAPPSRRPAPGPSPCRCRRGPAPSSGPMSGRLCTTALWQRMQVSPLVIALGCRLRVFWVCTSGLHRIEGVARPAFARIARLHSRPHSLCELQLAGGEFFLG